MAASLDGAPPVTLSCLFPGFYEDQRKRLWMVVNMGFRAFHPIPNLVGNTEQLVLEQKESVDEKKRLWMIVHLGLRADYPTPNSIGPYMTVHLWQVDNIEQLVLEQDVPFGKGIYLDAMVLPSSSAL
ncbi:hypothetical protein STEG23_010151 [Scotinomys teguina]